MSLPNVEAVTESIRFMETAAGLHPGGHIERVLEAARAYVNAVEFDAPHTVDVPGHYLLIKLEGQPK